MAGAAQAGAAVVAAAAEARRIGWAVVAFLGVTSATSLLRAEPSPAELRAARQLFASAEKDEDHARWADALDKLRRVSQVKLTAGVHYHIALCEEHLGQLAAALDEYTSAEDQARQEKAQDVMALVDKRIADLGPRVPRLTIRLVPNVQDAEVTLDGTRLPQTVLGTALPVDPGEHRIEATAPNRAPTTQHVMMRERDVTAIEVQLVEPPPAPAPAPAPAAPPAAEPLPAAPPLSASRSATSHTGALLATAGAVVLVGGGVGAYVLAGSAHTSAVEQCAQVVSLSPGACDSQKNSVRAWDFTAAGAWVGAAVVGAVAVVAWVRTPSPATSALLLVGPTSVSLAGHF